MFSLSVAFATWGKYFPHGITRRIALQNLAVNESHLTQLFQHVCEKMQPTWAGLRVVSDSERKKEREKTHAQARETRRTGAFMVRSTIIVSPKLEATRNVKFVQWTNNKVGAFDLFSVSDMSNKSNHMQTLIKEPFW